MPGFQNRLSSILGRAIALPSHTRGGSRMRESRPYGSVRGARDETRVPTATLLHFRSWHIASFRCAAEFGRYRWWSQRVDATLYLKEKRWSVAMGQGFRRGFTTAEKTELWDRWQRGESLKAIGRAFGKPSSSIYFQVSPHGGIRPVPRRRSRLVLTLAEREEISRGIAVHRSARSMAGLLGRSPSTVSREISRNGGYDGYRAALAEAKPWARPGPPR